MALGAQLLLQREGPVKAILLKLDSAVHKLWSKAAKAEKMPLSEWIRARVMESHGRRKIWEVNDEDDSAKDAGRVRATGRARRRTRVATGRNTNQFVNDIVDTGIALRNSRGPEHDPTCQCGVCQFKREALKKK